MDSSSSTWSQTKERLQLLSNALLEQGVRTDEDVENSEDGGGEDSDAVVDPHATEDVTTHMLDCYSSVYNTSGRIGIYTREERRNIVQRFHAKRKRRVWKKKIRYHCRKNLADRRLRVKGRFIKAGTPEAEEYRLSQLSNNNGEVGLDVVDEGEEMDVDESGRVNAGVKIEEGKISIVPSSNAKGGVNKSGHEKKRVSFGNKPIKSNPLSVFQSSLTAASSGLNGGKSKSMLDEYSDIVKSPTSRDSVSLLLSMAVEEPPITGEQVTMKKLVSSNNDRYSDAMTDTETSSSITSTGQTEEEEDTTTSKPITGGLFLLGKAISADNLNALNTTASTTTNTSTDDMSTEDLLAYRKMRRHSIAY